MKKVLIGCGIMFGLFLLVVGLGIFATARFASTVLGDVKTAVETVAKMPVDRLDQEAQDLTAEELGTRVVELVNKPVRVKGRVYPWGLDAQSTQGNAEVTSPLMFLEPLVMVLGFGEAFRPGEYPDGCTVEVLGVAARVNLANVPFLNDEGRKRLKETFGSTEQAPVVVARRVKLVALPAPDAKPVDKK